MTVLMISVVATVAFVAAFRVSGLINYAAEVIAITRDTLSVIRDRTIGDDRKETAVRRAAARLFLSFGQIFARTVFVVLPPVAVVYAAHLLELATAGGVIEFMSQWTFIIPSTGAALLLWWRWR